MTTQDKLDGLKALWKAYKVVESDVLSIQDYLHVNSKTFTEIALFLGRSPELNWGVNGVNGRLVVSERVNELESVEVLVMETLF